MPRYVAKRPAPRSWWEGEGDGPVVTHVEVEGPASAATGLLDRDGNELLRLPDRIGFLRFED